MILIWLLIFVLSLTLLVKSADWFVESAEKIGLALKISPFIIGVTIVAIGTSFPELASSIAAVLKGESQIVAANVIGSNIANIFLIVGLSAIVARILVVKRSLIDLDAPLLAGTTALFVLISLDKRISLSEGIFLIVAFLIYLLYTIAQRKGAEEPEMEKEKIVEVLPSRADRRERKIFGWFKKRERLGFKVFLFLILGIIGLIIGANYTIDSLIKLSEILKIPSSLVAIFALAVGTSLPELAVSLKAAAKKKYEIALGNVFGSNVFNVLLITGVPSLISPLSIDNLTFSVGLPFLVVATVLFVISGISKRVHIWEGSIYLLLYVLFLIKLFNFF